MSLKDFWTPDMRQRFTERFGADAPTTHENCLALFGVARPGKTKRDKSKRQS